MKNYKRNFCREFNAHTQNPKKSLSNCSESEQKRIKRLLSDRSVANKNEVKCAEIAQINVPVSELFFFHEFIMHGIVEPAAILPLDADATDFVIVIPNA